MDNSPLNRFPARVRTRIYKLALVDQKDIHINLLDDSAKAKANVMPIKVRMCNVHNIARGLGRYVLASYLVRWKVLMGYSLPDPQTC